MTVVLDNIVKLAALQEAAKPELIVNVSDPTATAIELAALFAAREDFCLTATLRSASRPRLTTYRGPLR